MSEYNTFEKRIQEIGRIMSGYNVSSYSTKNTRAWISELLGCVKAIETIDKIQKTKNNWRQNDF